MYRRMNAKDIRLALESLLKNSCFTLDLRTFLKQCMTDISNGDFTTLKGYMLANNLDSPSQCQISIRRFLDSLEESNGSVKDEKGCKYYFMSKAQRQRTGIEIEKYAKADGQLFNVIWGTVVDEELIQYEIEIIEIDDCERTRKIFTNNEYVNLTFQKLD